MKSQARPYAARAAPKRNVFDALPAREIAMQLKWIFLAAAAAAFAYWWSRQPKLVFEPGCGHGLPPGQSSACVIRYRKQCPQGLVYDHTKFWGFGGCVRPEEAVLY
jgi:hypothetical protein